MGPGSAVLLMTVVVLVEKSSMDGGGDAGIYSDLRSVSLRS